MSSLPSALLLTADEESSEEREDGDDEPAAVVQDYDEYDDDMPSSTALGLGVTIAVVAIVVAGGLAAFCAHRGRFASSHAGHQTLTSFENPIYDAGHVTVPVK